MPEGPVAVPLAARTRRGRMLRLQGVISDHAKAGNPDMHDGNPPLNFHFLVVDSGRRILLVVDGGVLPHA